MKKKSALSILTAALLIACLTACGANQTTSASASAGNGETIVSEMEDAAFREKNDGQTGLSADQETAGEEAGGSKNASQAVTAPAPADAAKGATASESGQAGASAAAGEESASGVTMLENGGLKLPVPAEYMDLMETRTPEEAEDGVLFSFSEKESIEAARKLGEETEGAGWLFDIGTISPDQVKQMLSEDRTGRELFARGADGTGYVFYHPTDVRIVREKNEDYDSALQEGGSWSVLNEWGGSVPETFVKVNEGLTAEKHSGTNLDIYLGQIEYAGKRDYTVSTLEHGPLEPGDVDPTPYVDRFVNGAVFSYCDEEEAPDGEYAVLTFPGDNVRYDFFSMDGKQNIVREVRELDDETYEVFFKAEFADGQSTAYGIMKEWYDALVKAAGH